MIYDPADNSAKSYTLAIKEIRLGKIRRGELTPRKHVPDEMKAYRDGRNGRRAIAVALSGAFTLVAALAYLSQDSEPDVKNGAAIALQGVP